MLSGHRLPQPLDRASGGYSVWLVLQTCFPLGQVNETVAELSVTGQHLPGSVKGSLLPSSECGEGCCRNLLALLTKAPAIATEGSGCSAPV